MIVSYKTNCKNWKKRICNKNIFVIQEDVMQKNNKKLNRKNVDTLRERERERERVVI